MATPTNKSVVKSFRVLSVFQERGSALSLTQIAGLARLSIATTHRFVITLRSVGALRTDSEGRYLLGPQLIALGEQAARQAAAQDVLKRCVARCAKSVKETVHVGIRSGSMVRYVAKAESSDSRIASRVGTELEAYCTGIGKVLLAHATPQAIDRYLRIGVLVKLTPNTITSKDALRKELARIRDRGMAVDNEEFEEGLKCVAVPIAAANGEVVVASLSVSGPVRRMDRYSLPRLVKTLNVHSRAIGQKMRAEDWAAL